MNQVLKTIQERSSIRSYKDIPLTQEELDLLKTQSAAPTARNLQGLATISLQIARSLNKLINASCIMQVMRCAPNEGARIRKFFHDAPLGVIITAGEQRWPGEDAGIAVGILS